MNSTTREPLNVTGEERELLAALLEAANARLLVEIRHTDHRAFREELRRRLTLLEGLMERCPSTMTAGSGGTGPDV
jgi:hypothetical protein